MRVRLLIACCILVLASTPRTKNKCPRANEPTSDSNYKSSVLQKYAKLRFFLSLSPSLFIFSHFAHSFSGEKRFVYSLSLSLSPLPAAQAARTGWPVFCAERIEEVGDQCQWIEQKRERERGVLLIGWQIYKEFYTRQNKINRSVLNLSEFPLSPFKNFTLSRVPSL